jgi:hypothetical protein
LRIGPRAQRGAAFPAGEGKSATQVQTGCVDAVEIPAPHRVGKDAARTSAGNPLAAEMVGKEFGHGSIRRE